MSRVVMRYVNRLVAKKVIPEVMEDREIEYYVAPHIKGQEDILGMWDMVCFSKMHKTFSFVQVCARSGKRRCIERHRLMTAEMYPNTDAVKFYLITYWRKSGRYCFNVEEIVQEGGEVKMMSRLKEYVPERGV